MLACIKMIISLSAAGVDYTLASGVLVWLVVLWDFLLMKFMGKVAGRMGNAHGTWCIFHY